MASSVRLYISSMSSSRDIKNKQMRMLQILESKKIPFEKVDIATDKVGRGMMRSLTKNPNPTPPIITAGNKYLGGFQEFMEAVDDEILDKFLDPGTE